MNNREIEKIIESILFSSGEVVYIQKICEILKVDKTIVINCCEKLVDLYKDSGIDIIKINDGYQMCTKSQYYDYISKYISTKKNSPLSNAAMEVLSIVAYNQPVTKGFVEQIRGVDSSSIVNSLVDKKLLKENGRLNLPGRPISYKTTDNFLRCFNLGSLKELPDIDLYRECDNIKLEPDVLENQLTL